MKISQTILSIAAAMLTVASALAETQVQDSKAMATYAPRPSYPSEARWKHITGRGVVLVTIDRNTGSVTNAKMIRSTGSPILDNAAMWTYRQWRFRAPCPRATVQIPVTFSISGNQAVTSQF